MQHGGSLNRWSFGKILSDDFFFNGFAAIYFTYQIHHFSVVFFFKANLELTNCHNGILEHYKT